MLVSDLLRYRSDVESTIKEADLTPALQLVHTKLNQLLNTHPHGIGESKLVQAKAQFGDLINNGNKITSGLDTILTDINTAIDSMAAEFFPQTDLEFFNPYYGAFEFHTSNEVITTLTANIHHSANFHYPALQLGCTPHSKMFTGELVANDPLYLCDHDAGRIEDIANQFNEIYYRRIRRYVLENHDTSALPHNQFGFVFSWMLFNYTNTTCIREYLKKVIALLRPGGRFLFSYNNCDILDNCLLAEKQGMSYLSMRQLTNICQEEGFEIVYHYDIPNDDPVVKWISWIEIKKPGELNTLKRKQVMGAIYQK